MSGSSHRAPEDEASRSTARPPKTDEEPSEDLDLEAALRAAKTGTSAAAPQATAKIAPFQLAEALARISKESPASSHPPESVEPKPMVSTPTPLVELAPEEIAALLAKSRSPSLPSAPEPAVVQGLVAEAQDTTPTTAAKSAKAISPLVLLFLAIGIAAMVYAYLAANR